MSAPLLEIEDLSTWIESGDATVRAVDGLSLSIRRGETYALLGESGCGKSVTALSVMRLLPDAGRVVAGQVKLDGQDLLQLPENQMRNVRGGRIGMIFQEPMLSLNPVLTVGAQIGEVLERHLGLKGDAAAGKARELLDAVGVPDAARRLGEYPFQLSGGLRQRVMIAMALACEPELLIADEPTTALDVTIQAQVLELLRDLQRRRGMAMLLITHDLGVVAETAHRVGVMYAGQIVESAPCETFFADPKHPYSRKLFASMPTQRKRGETLAVIGGTVPSLAREFTGCRFADRCDQILDHCASQTPDLIALTPAQHIRCHLFLQQNGVRSGLLHTEPQPQQIEQEGVRSRLLQPEVHQRQDRQDGVQFQQDQDNSKTLQPEVQHARPDPIAIQAQRELTSSRPFHPEVQQSRPDPSAVALLEVSDLRVHFPIQRGILRRVVGYVRAVDGVSLTIPAGRTLALVGESGCGKTTVGKAVLQLLRPTGGEVLFDGQDLGQLGASELRAQRQAFQIVFQDPYSSLNPRMRVAEIIEEGMAALGVGATPEERAARIDALLGEVGLDSSARSRYPHEFSGGQRQRIAIARALAVEPRLIICDEPTSALDVSVQAQILNLLLDLQRRRGIAYLFITHNMGVVQFLAHEVAVMYLGRVVEHGSVDEVFGAPKHPYTQALLSAVPIPDPRARRDVLRIPGDLPSPVTPPAGCHFHPRCPKVFDACRATFPTERVVEGTHRVRCHLYD